MVDEVQKLIEYVREAESEIRYIQDAVNRGTSGRELALAYTKMQEAEFWLKEAENLLLSI